MKKLLALTLYILLFGTSDSFGQPIYFKHYRVEDGLSNNTVFTALQDHRGFMWFGTKEGLNRFDGNSFKSYNDARFPDALRGFVLQLEKAANGFLWVGTQNGIYKFDEQKEIFTAVRGIPNKEIEQLKVDEEGNLWVLINGELSSYDEKNNFLSKFKLRTGGQVASFTITEDTVWACTVDGYLFRIDRRTKKPRCINLGNPFVKDKLNRIVKIFCFHSLVFIGSTSGLITFDPENNVSNHVIPPLHNAPPAYVRDMIEYAQNRYWVATENGIFLFDYLNNKLEHLTRNYADPFSLSDNAVYSLFKDREGGIWATTYFGGVNYFHPQHSRFKKFFANASQNAISGNGVREICSDGYGNIWVGTEDAGLNKINKRSGKITFFKSTGRNDGISSNNIHGLLAVEKELWIGTFQRGLDILDISSGKVVRHYSAKDPNCGLESNFITSIYSTRRKVIYIGTSRGLYKYDPKPKRFIKISKLPTDLYVSSLIEDDKGILWIGTIGAGAFHYNPSNEEWGNFRHNTNNQNSLSSNMVSSIFQDSQKQFWFGTENGGLSKFEPSSRRFTTLTTDAGLPSNLVLKVLEDTLQNLWITTSKGLVCYKPKIGQLEVFTRAHGLLTDQFNYNSALNDNGKFYFGSVGGMISFDPLSLKPNPTIPKIFITSFQLDNKELMNDGEILSKSITSTDTITLNHDQSSFSIGFAALTYIAPQVTEYAYLMSGMDKSWTVLKNNRRVYFTKLSSGTYIFLVKLLQDSHHSKIERKLVLIINKPLYLSNTALFIYLCSIIGFVYLAISGYRRRVKLKDRRRIEHIEVAREKEIYNAKIQFFTNVAHEIRTPLTLIKGPLENVIDEVGELPSVRKYLRNIERNTERLLSLTNQLLDFRKIEDSGLSLSYVQTDVGKLLMKIINAYSVLIAEKKLLLVADINTKLISAFIDVEAFTKIMNNLIGNAVKYGEKYVEVKLIMEENRSDLCVKVINDGFIIPVSLKDKIFESFYRISETQQKSGSGIGLSLARSLAELHGGSLILSSDSNELNTFILLLPIHQSIEFKLNLRNKKL